MSLDYGLIGNCETAAIVSKEGSIDWCCFPRFDSPSVFAKMLDEEKGGSFEIVPVGKYRIAQKYVPNTNILETTFRSRGAEFRLFDFFPRYRSGEKIDRMPWITRYLKVVRGRPKVKVIFNPKMDYARGATKVRKVRYHLTASNGNEMLFLYSDLDRDKISGRKPIELSGDHFLIASYMQHLRPSVNMVRRIFNKTKSYWRDFVRFSTLPPGFRKDVIRSILVLKLLTYPSGAVVAAPTTSLPEVVGEGRNWDYRYCWLRDSSFTIDTLTKICHFDEAEAFINWLTGICTRPRKELQPMYRVDGSRSIAEKELGHLKGYKGSSPVRIGNSAFTQHQIDVYGEVMETFYLFFYHYNYKEIELQHWKAIRKLVEVVMSRWREKDSGLWEFRGTKRHFVFSKLMCWVALDRGAKLAKKRHEPELARKWTKERDAIKKEIMKKGWNPKIQAFTQSYGSDDLDASNLLMTYFGFVPAKHPRMRKTIEITKKELMKGCFVFRYVLEDDFGKPKNAFTICTFWLIDALYATGKKKEATDMFKHVLKHSNYLGLFSEDIEPATGRLTGNFPQAYTHLALVNTAVLLSTNQTRRNICNIRIDMLQD